MDLIVKPTVKCNFRCTFCSSTHLSDDANDIVTIADIRRFIQRYPETNTIIVNGGDPLMMPPSYYWQMIEMLDNLDSKASISFTSNLWAFFKKPDMWTELFRHPRMGITTSFQYGDKRIKGDGTVFTEEDFRNVLELYRERLGHNIDFIAVIDEDNKHSVIKTVQLAKEFDVEAKINYVVASGKKVNNRGIIMGSEDNFFTQADMYKLYIDIYDAGLAEWEYNTKQMMRRLRTADTTCPLAINCDEGIRAMQPGGGYYSCGSFGDDGEFPIDFEREMAGEFFTPLRDVERIQTMKDSCYACPMFSICNGCKKTVADTKKMNLVEHHCKVMKSIALRIIEINGMTGLLEPTPYIDESLPLIAKG